MNPVGDEADALCRAAIAALMRDDGGRLLASLVANFRDFQLAEDSLQDALESALHHWSRNGLPTSPPAWLLRTARRKALDRLRRNANLVAKSAQIALQDEIMRADQDSEEAAAIGDDRLRLIFTCCHPALDQRTSIALTLRSVAGLTTSEIARLFVVSEDAMAQRLVRARHKIAHAKIAYAVPAGEDLSARLDAVLRVVYLMFTEGHSASDGELFRPLLCNESIRLALLLGELLPGEPEIDGLRALMLLHTARNDTRLTSAGDMVALQDQDRTRWDQARIAEGVALTQQALRQGRPGPYQLQSAIAAIHCESLRFEDTDWHQIALIYEVLSAVHRNPVFELNRVVAISYYRGEEAALVMLDAIAQPLDGYQPYYAVRADLLSRTMKTDAAIAAYDRAIALSQSDAERLFLRSRRARLTAADNGKR